MIEPLYVVKIICFVLPTAHVEIDRASLHRFIHAHSVRVVSLHPEVHLKRHGERTFIRNQPHMKRHGDRFTVPTRGSARNGTRRRSARRGRTWSMLYKVRPTTRRRPTTTNIFVCRTNNESSVSCICVCFRRIPNPRNGHHNTWQVIQDTPHLYCASRLTYCRSKIQSVSKTKPKHSLSILGIATRVTILKKILPRCMLFRDPKVKTFKCFWPEEYGMPPN